MWVMYDDVTVSLIPASAQAVLGYVDGNFPTKAAVDKGWPNAHKVFLTVNGSSDADGIDSEPGDATPDVVVRWVKNKLAAGGYRPIVYASLSDMQPLLNELAVAGVERSQVRVMTAHVTEVPHLCTSACGFGFTGVADATQWTFTALGRSLDESLVQSDFFAPKPAPPKPADPHHYKRFGAQRSNVEEYDAFRRHPIKNRKVLKLKRAQLLKGADVIASHVIAEAKATGRTRDWSKDYRGWRYQQLVHRANGKRVVK